MTHLPPFDGRRRAVPVVGIDPSLTAAGFAHAGGRRVIGEKGKAGATLTARRERLQRSATTIALAVAEAAAEVGAAGALVVIEAPSLGQGRQAGTNDRIGLWWLLVDELFDAGHLVVEVAPASRAKYATGKGTSGKTAVASAAAARYRIDGGFADDNEADAFVLRAMGLHRLGAPLAVVPKTHAAALEAVAWPTELELEQLVALPLLGHRRPTVLDAVDVAAAKLEQLPVPGQLALDGAVA